MIVFHDEKGSVAATIMVLFQETPAATGALFPHISRGTCQTTLQCLQEILRVISRDAFTGCMTG